jgi:hypothetical protein
MPTRPIDLPLVEEPATKLEPIPRHAFEEPAPLTETSPPPLIARSRGRWLIMGAVALVAAIAVMIAQPRGDRTKPAIAVEPSIERAAVDSIEIPAPPRAPPQAPQAPPKPRREEATAIALSSKPSAVVLDARTEARLGRTPMELKLPKGESMELLLVAPGRKPQPLVVDGKIDRIAVELERSRPKRRAKRKAPEDPPPPPPAPAKSKGVQMPEW